MRPILVAALALAATTGCLTEPQAPASGGPAKDALRLEVYADPEEFTNRTNITVKLTVLEPVTHRSTGCSFPIVLANLSQERQVALYGYDARQDPEADSGCLAMIHEVSLTPGTYWRNVSWNGHQEGDPPRPHLGQRAPPSEYTIYVYLPSADFKLSAQTTVRLRS